MTPQGDPGSPESGLCPGWWGLCTGWVMGGAGLKVAPHRPASGTVPPIRVALMGHVPPMWPRERPPCVARAHGDILLPRVPTERPPCHGETPAAGTEMPPVMSAMEDLAQETPSPTAEPPAVPSAEDGKDPCGPGKPGTCPGEVTPVMVPVQPASLQTPAEQPGRLVPRGSCLIHSWQDEVTTGWGPSEMPLETRVPRAVSPPACRQPPLFK